MPTVRLISRVSRQQPFPASAMKDMLVPEGPVPKSSVSLTTVADSFRRARKGLVFAKTPLNGTLSLALASARMTLVFVGIREEHIASRKASVSKGQTATPKTIPSQIAKNLYLITLTVLSRPANVTKGSLGVIRNLANAPVKSFGLADLNTVLNLDSVRETRTALGGKTVCQSQVRSLEFVLEQTFVKYIFLFTKKKILRVISAFSSTMEKFLEKKELVSLAVALPQTVKPLKSAFLTEKVVKGRHGWDEYVVKKKFLPNGQKHGKQYEKGKRYWETFGISASFRDGLPHGKFWLKKRQLTSLTCVSGVFNRGKLEELEIQTEKMKSIKILYEDGVPGICLPGDSPPFRMYDKERNLFTQRKEPNPFQISNTLAVGKVMYLWTHI
ncbi:hypothetical protein [Brazilian marseillevirus]|uniref:hypothetical protein n=1 Tax=Brazilian marseillevirus TaxID=1813599 RepID=UPI00078447F5|nr:hypothetical protein A3303_gp233 [Brazilian marseillevirus]AMQ10741.1 hypothetical protein [Brazilian marseillevirus]